jgi:hypothetical protein
MIAGRSTASRFWAGLGLYGAIAAYVIFALFPIYWTLKISVTPQSLLYSEGVRLWPSAVTLENFSTVLRATDFPRYFMNSVIVSLTTAAFVTIIASLAGYAMSRFTFRGKATLAIMLLLTQTFPLVMVIPPIYRVMGQLGLTNSLTGLIIIYTAFNTAFATFLMQSFLRRHSKGPGGGGDDRRLHPPAGHAQGDRAADLAGHGRYARLRLHCGVERTAVCADADLQRREEDVRRRPSHLHRQIRGGLGADDGGIDPGADPRLRLLRLPAALSGDRPDRRRGKRVTPWPR